tara:strand:+ start:183 stop:794 length:612 start_codon:yes stop_codon:yes gene_type:complete
MNSGLSFIFICLIASATLFGANLIDDCQPWECKGGLLTSLGVITPFSFSSKLVNSTSEIKNAKPLSDHIQPAAIFGMGLELNYFNQIEMDLKLQYARLDAINSETEVVPLHLVLVEAGYSYVFYGRWGAGLGMHFIRARSTLDRPMLLEDNESDFGHYLRYSSMRYKVSDVSLGAGITHWSVWTKPAWSQFIGIEIQGSYLLW